VAGLVMKIWAVKTEGWVIKKVENIQDLRV